MTALEETMAQLQANNNKLMSRIVAIEGSLTANGSGSGSGSGDGGDGGDGGDPTSTSSSLLSFIVWLVQT